MDGFVFSSAQGAVDSLLGRLATALTDEAQLLRGVRGDVRFIRDEMDSMNGLLLHLAAGDAGAGHGHHHVRAWMRQVRDLANDSQGCVNRYVRHLGATARSRRRGPLGYLRRAHRLLWTLRARRRIAREIQELKVRAREVGERRKRYGITVPLPLAGGGDQADRARCHVPPVPLPHATAGPGDDARRLALEGHEGPVVSGEDVRKLTKWLTEDAYDNGRLRIIPVAGPNGMGKSALAWRVYRHPAVAARFDCRAWCNVGDPHGGRSWADVAARLLGSLETRDGVGVQRWEDDAPVSELKAHLKGRRFLLVLDGLEEQPTLAAMEETLRWCPYDAGSAVLVTTRNETLVLNCDTYSILHLKTRPSVVDAFMDRALTMVPDVAYGMAVVLRKILSRFSTDPFYMKMLLHLLYVNPSRTMQELQGLSTRLTDEEPLKNAKQMFMFSYDDLPSHYKSCLLYLAIFPQGCSIRRNSLIRRWAVEGLVGKTDGFTALEAADRCFDALLDRGFVVPRDIGAASRVKSCRLDPSVHDFITWIARYDNFVDTNLPSSLSQHLSICNGVDLQQVAAKRHASNCKGLRKICCCFPVRKVSGCCDSIVVLLEWLPSFSRLELLKVLDLEACDGLKKHHLEIICNQIYQLKYLCLRRTNVTRLPKDINKLRYLETLDIRETKIRDFGTKPLMLQMLKHLLAGSIDYSPREDIIRSNGSFSTVYMPHCIGIMGNLQVLSHVQVSHNDQLDEISQLLQLRKLGLVLSGKEVDLKHFLRAIDELHSCLRSLSIKIKESCNVTSEMHMVNPLFKRHPKFLESLSICSLRNELPYWVDELHQLAKITLSETFLTENALRTLGQLKGLRCLRLRHNSFVASRLAFGESEFRNLTFLVIERTHITNISFSRKATPKLENVVWSFTQVQSISGIGYLERLHRFELNGISIPYSVREANAAFPNHYVFKYNLQSRG
ncbi:disease resistance protein RPM1-like [Panicum miliaceum]|uniref:Disease resistance protein RPM1-like n=1 Tax=Panicum miliaceum TaxID=4540 RepID=A0A3L6PMR7_PANMI|nr:disease resistance protein RPM1-like [Panicum miliaceum]